MPQFSASIVSNPPILVPPAIDTPPSEQPQIGGNRPTNSNDQLTGTASADRLSGLGGADQIFGKGGNDRLSGNAGNDQLLGESGNDILVGGGGNDVLRGGDGNDRLRGGPGNDTLFGDRGSDVLQGGGGRDIFALQTGAGRDKILDFENGGDRLGLSNGLRFRDLSFAKSGRNTLIRAGNDPLALVMNTQPNQLTVADFTAV
jgi:Ca2+-binding RTX toxin-like protein